jgi:chromosome partitioning protein
MLGAVAKGAICGQSWERAQAPPDLMPTVVAVINQKGGVGKTTTAVNLGAALAASGKPVLLIDLDPQANLTSHVGLEPGDDAATIYDVLLGERPLRDAIHATEEAGLYAAPSTIDLSAVEIETAGVASRETILRDALETLKADGEAGLAPRFEHVVVDCPPSLGVLSINALAAADSVVVPMQAEFFALQGMAKLTEVVDLVRGRLNPRLRFDGVVACKVDRRPRLTEEVLQEIRTHFPGKLYDVVVRPNVKLAEAPSFGKSVFSYARDSHGAEDYRAFAAEYQKRSRALMREAALAASAAAEKKRGAEAPSSGA